MSAVNGFKGQIARGGSLLYSGICHYAMSGSTVDLERKIELQTQVLESRRADLENIKRTIMTELSVALPAMIDFRLREILQQNPQLINGVSDEQITILTSTLSTAKERSVKRVLDQLSTSPYWYDCTGIGQSEKARFSHTGPLFEIIQHVEDEFVPIFSNQNIKRKYTSNGKTDILPLNLSFLPSTKLASLADSYEQFLESFCEAEKILKGLQANSQKV